ncbi:conserved hypothetical protein [Sphingomonas sp. EC-HK361]|uniref:DUF6597 domain-containing transcriptional factor n=1 Tax=Sphingomonas sp. EC-HK361 TaxID=2038397 RepID=UPI001256ACC3|nr:DUF6597 domain-containing transcriptional factor [Sphingomonas sp. EC-HK361]VVT19492.1 conserved hypothetical protein [Sphingomonas sp. EC-HK361]
MDRNILIAGTAGDAAQPGMPAGTRVSYFQPAPDLRTAITGYNAYAALSDEPRVDRFLPAPAMLCVSVDAGPVTVEIGRHRFDPVATASLYGPTTRPMRITSRGGGMIGIGISPIGWARLTRRAATDIQNRVVPVTALLGERLADRLARDLAATKVVADIAPTLDAVLAPLLAKPYPEEPLIAALAAVIVADGDPDIGTVAAMLGVPTAKLRRTAMRYFGMTPKLLLRRARFLRSFLRDNGLDGTGRKGEIDRSYFDQSHYLRDAQTFLNTTPRRFLMEEHVFLMGSLHARAAALGAPTQALHAVERDAA